MHTILLAALLALGAQPSQPEPDPGSGRDLPESSANLDFVILNRTGQTIVELSTDNVDMELPAPGAGVITEILAAAGDTVHVGQVIARMLQTESSGNGPGTAHPDAGAPKRKATVACTLSSSIAALLATVMCDVEPNRPLTEKVAGRLLANSRPRTVPRLVFVCASASTVRLPKPWFAE